MGEFLIRVDGAPQIVVPNITHDEGVEYLLNCVFPPHSDIPTLKMHVSGYSSDFPWDRPNDGGWPVFEATGRAAIFNPDANPDGAWAAKHASLMDLQPVIVNFTATAESGGVKIETNECVFRNALQWEPTPDSFYHSLYDPAIPGSEVPPPPPWKDLPHWEPVRRYPWQRPRIHADHYLRDTPEVAQEVADDIASNMHYGASFPLSNIFIYSDDDLFFSGNLLRNAHITLRPEGVLYVKWRGRIQPKP